MEPARGTGAAMVRLQVHSPTNVQVGEVFEVRIDVDAYGGIRELMFTVRYERSRLSLVHWAEGDFARQGGLPSGFGAQEPSDGNIDVTFKVHNGLSVAGAGSLAVLQFEALRSGTSGIEPKNLTAIDPTGAPDRNVAILREGRVTIH
jgi:hypothetical protein